MLSSVSSNGQTARTLSPSVQGDTAGIPDRSTLEQFAPTEPIQKASFWLTWGWPAILDLILGRMALKRLSPLVPHTFVPIIKLCSGNREEVDAAYKIILGYREPIRFFDSPREKWRKAYGNYVREIEWACSELRKYFNKQAYEDLVINATADYIREVLGPIIEQMKISQLKQREYFSKKSDLTNKIGAKMTALFFKVFNITGWLAGKTILTEVNLREGLMVMDYPDCQMLRAPRMKNLPEESCLLSCKGGCEKLFEEGIVKMTLDAQLPETTCVVRMFIVDD